MAMSGWWRSYLKLHTRLSDEDNDLHTSVYQFLWEGVVHLKNLHSHYMSTCCFRIGVIEKERRVWKLLASSERILVVILSSWNRAWGIISVTMAFADSKGIFLLLCTWLWSYIRSKKLCIPCLATGCMDSASTWSELKRCIAWLGTRNVNDLARLRNDKRRISRRSPSISTGGEKYSAATALSIVVRSCCAWIPFT